jgi:hypothetical protein
MLVAYNYSSLCDILGNLIKNGICVEKDDVKYNIFGNINVFSSSRLTNKDLNYIYNQLNTIVSPTYEYINLYTGNTEEKKNSVRLYEDIILFNNDKKITFNCKINSKLFNVNPNTVWFDENNHIFNLPENKLIWKLTLKDFKRSERIASPTTYIYNSYLKLDLEIDCMLNKKIRSELCTRIREMLNITFYSKGIVCEEKKCSNCKNVLFDNVYKYANITLCCMCFIYTNKNILNNNTIFLEEHKTKLKDILDRNSLSYDLIVTFRNSYINYVNNQKYVETEKYIGISENNICLYLCGLLNIPNLGEKKIVSLNIID